ncbi:MAG: PQQ-dependent sugar dehydrogenase [Deltaproteobacteria bacterium]|nr:PQQ-dependent sugar dehydrogenase [Deltaproteobacteria bacterium]
MSCFSFSMRRRISSALLIGLVASAQVLAPALVRAQACALSADPRFAGHAFPLDTDPVPQAMRFDQAFPALSFGGLVDLHAAPDGTNRLFVVEQVGRIHVFENRNDVSLATGFLDIRSLVQSGGQEQGLLGLAFDPGYATNRRFFVNYTATTGCTNPGAAGCTKIVRYEADPTDPNRALTNSATPILEFAQPFDNHNGGAIAFGPDGYLYVATGDGGDGGDPFRNAQNRASRLGKLLRLDVSPGATSLAPPTNPFVGVPNTDPLVYHYGLRNPWRISFDRVTGDLLIGDVGQGIREEVDRVRAGSPGGLNFGWDYCEGTLDYRSGTTCSAIQSTPPVVEYQHFDQNGGEVIVGGYVYRGDLYPELYGAYLYADPSSGNVWAWGGQDPANPQNPGNPGVKIAIAPPAISSFGEDQTGEIFAVSSVTGLIYRLVRNGSSGSGASFPATLSSTGLFSDVASLTPAPGLIEYDVMTPLWSDGATKRRWMALPGEGRVGFHAREAWEFPVGTVFVKHFELPKPGGTTRRVETRVFLRQVDRWIGMTYRWNTAGTDATRLDAGLDEVIDLGSGASQSWHYPSPTECLSCHTAASGRVLGVRTRNLEGTRSYAGGTQSQIEAWNCAKLFDFDIRERSRYDFSRAIGDASATRTKRARSYIASNCEMCHQPGAPAPGGLDMRFTTAVGQWNVINVAPSEGNLGFPSAKRILPGNRFNSILWIRQSVTDPLVRMAKGTTIADAPAVNLIGSWIQTDVATVDSDEDGVADTLDRCPAVADPLQQDGDQDGLGDRCDPDALPDLTIQSQTTPTGTVVPGQTLAFSATLKNDGAGASASFPVTFHLSENTTLEIAHDVPVGECWVESLNAGATTTCSTSSARIPASFLTGQPGPVTYRWIACANRAQVERQGNTANDCVVAPQSVSVPEPIGMLGFGVGIAGMAAACDARRRRARRASAGR